MNKTPIQTAFALAFGTVSLTAHAATLNTGDQLTITAGVYSYNEYGNLQGVSSGSWFGMDTNNNAKIASIEKTAVAMGTTGIIIGTATTAGASHSGMPTGADTDAITAPWDFFGNTGSDYTTIGIAGGTDGMSMSGWTVTWNGIPAINMGGGAWGTGFSNGVGNFVWDGIYGHTYTLDYRATVPDNDPSGFGGVKYALHLTGNIVAVPEVSTYGMMLAGLGLVGFAARRRKPG